MRILFVPAPFKSHLYVQVPLAWALRTAGHDVCVAGSPDMAAEIAATGLPGVVVGGGVDKAAPDAHQWRGALKERMRTVPRAVPRRGGKPAQTDYFGDDAYGEFDDFTLGVRAVFYPDSAVRDLVEFARDWRPDLVITDPTAFPGAAAARICGAAHARMLFGVDRVMQLRAAARDELTAVGDPVRDWLEPVLREFGCAFDEGVASGDWTISPMPEWIYRPDGVRYLPMRHVPFNGPATTPRWVFEEPERRRVCMTLGLSHREDGLGVTASARSLFDAVADLDCEVVATFNADQLAQVPNLPDNVRAVDFVPLNDLLTTCSAIVHSGGAGTFASALEHGVPQIIVPSDFKQEKWWGPLAMAVGLEERGIGFYTADADTLTAEALHDDLQRLLTDPAYAANAARVRTEVQAMPTPNDVVPVLEKLTAEFKRA